MNPPHPSPGTITVGWTQAPNAPYDERAAALDALEGKGPCPHGFWPHQATHCLACSDGAMKNAKYIFVEPWVGPAALTAVERRGSFTVTNDELPRLEAPSDSVWPPPGGNHPAASAGGSGG